MIRIRHLIAACVALFVTVNTASAQPTNDLCADVAPVALEAGSTIFFSGNNEDATIDGDNVPGSGLDDFGIAVVWAAFTTTECADVSISFCGSTAPFLSNYFWEVLAYDCPADQLVVSPLYNNEDCADGQPTIYFNELAAGTYYYPVWSQPGTAVGDYEIAISAVACASGGPANDACSGAEEHPLATGESLTITGDNTGATDNDGLGLPVVWESFTLAQCADVTIDHCGSDLTLDLLAMGIYQDCPASMYLDTTVIDTCPDGNLIMVFNDLAPGTYWVPVAMGFEGEAGPYTMHISAASCTGGPANDLCQGAELHELAVDDTLVITGDNTGATDSEGMGIANVWESFTLSECADVELSFCGTDPIFFALASSVFTDCPGTNEIMPDGFDACPDGNMLVSFTGLAPGTYWVPVVMMTAETEGPYTLTISAAACSVTTPPNDLCADAVTNELAPDDILVITGDNTGATNNDGLGLPVVWESFTLAECADVTIDHCGSDLTLNLLAIGIFMDCPATMYLDTTVIDTCPDGNLIMVFNDLAPGTYWVPVAMALEGEAGPYTMHISAASCTGGPANDLCQGAELHELAVDDTLVITGDNTGATDSEGMGIANVWESFTLSECADVELSLCGTSPDLFALVPSIFTDCPGTNEITPDDFDTCPDGNMLVNFTGLAPGTYWMPVIMITGEEGPYTLTLSAAACSVATPPNDLCEDAAPIAVVAPDSCAAGAVIGDNLQATGSGALPHCAEPGVQWQDLWYVFNAGDAEEVTITLEAGTMEGGGMEVFGACGDSIVCSLDGEPIELDVQPDSTYRVRVFTLEDGTPGTFVLCVTSDGTTGIGSSNAGSVLVYPNPGTGDFHFTPSIAWADASIRVLDVTGRTIHAEQADLRAGEPYPLLLSGKMKVGSYFLHISGPAGNSVIKLMVK